MLRERIFCPALHQTELMARSSSRTVLGAPTIAHRLPLLTRIKMQAYLLRVFLSYTILIPAVTSMIRYKVVLKDYGPFLWMIWLGLFLSLIHISEPTRQAE